MMRSANVLKYDYQIGDNRNRKMNFSVTWQLRFIRNLEGIIQQIWLIVE